MKKAMFIILAEIFFSFFLSSTLFSQWIRTPGPPGGTVSATYTIGSDFIIGTGNGDIYVSTNNGTSWILRNNGLPYNSSVSSFYKDGSILYAAMAGGIYFTTDEGNSWHTDSPNFQALVYSIVRSGNNLLAGVYYGGVYVSTDNGHNWIHSSNGLPEWSYVHALLVDGNRIYASAGNGVYISTNNGSWWDSASVGMPHVVVSSFLHKSNKIFAGTGGGVFVTTNNGSSWTGLNQGWPQYPGEVYLTTDSVNIFANSTLYGIFKTSNDGINWIVMNNGLPGSDPYYTIISISILNNSIIAGSNFLGVFKSTNGGNNWNFSGVGTASGSVKCLYADNNDLFAGSIFAGVALTTNNGDNWIQLSTFNDRVFLVNAIIRSGTNVLAGGGNDKIFLTTNNGANWSVVYSDSISRTGLRNFGKIGNILYASIGDSLIKSTDNGFNWAAIPNNFYFPNYFYSYGTDLYMLEDDGVFRSTNGGINWTNLGLQYYQYPSTIAVNGNTIFIGTGGNGIFRSTNNGVSWFYIGLSDGYTVLSMAVSDTNIFAIDSSTLYYSSNNGNNWSILEYLNPFLAYDIAIHNNYLFCATDHGVWKRPLSSIIGIIKLSNGVPQQYKLFQNYPNPFNPATKIKFDIPNDVKNQTQNVKVLIYDIIGREAATLVNEKLKPGSYEVEWNASAFSSGVYFYKLESDDFIQTKKMVLIK